MKITLMSIPVRDQELAHKFYTEKLGFITKTDQPLGGGNRWLTLVSKDDPDGIELLLEPGPLHFEPCKVYQDELLKAKMPYTQFDVDNLEDEYQRLLTLGVEFITPPTTYGEVKVAVLNDTVGNNIQLIEKL